MNDEAFLEFAGALAKRIVKDGGATDRDRLNYGYLLVLGRKPMPREATRLMNFLADQKQVYTEDSKAVADLFTRPGMTQPATGGAELAAWTSVSRVMFNLDDFMTRE
jgi:hypothetical protein